jgi:hypothetical protein
VLHFRCPFARVAEKAGVRVCADTAHAYVAGYDFSTPESGREIVQELRMILEIISFSCTSTTPETNLEAIETGTRGLLGREDNPRRRRGRSFSRHCAMFRW